MRPQSTYLVKCLSPNSKGSDIAPHDSICSRLRVLEGTKVEVSLKELPGGARIYYIFNYIFCRALASIDATHFLENQDIRTAIRNSMGDQASVCPKLQNLKSNSWKLQVFDASSWSKRSL